MHMLKRIDLKGYKSIKEVSLELRPLNILIGANGSGKSNLVSFFKLISNMMAGHLQTFIATSGGANSLLHYGAKSTSHVEAKLVFEADGSESEFHFLLGHAAEDALVILQEATAFRHRREGTAAFYDADPYEELPTDGHKEAYLSNLPELPKTAEAGIPGSDEVLKSILNCCRVFQLHDTSSTAGIRLNGDINQNRALAGDGGNLAAVLYRIQQTQPDSYHRIVGTIRQIAPFFDDFSLAPSALNPNVIQLRWKERDRDYDFGPHLLSDGTLRAMALVTLLLQPVRDLPPVIIIDEPELGLHPYALATLAGLMKSASTHAQIIVATESATLLDYFEPQDVVVTERCKGETVFKRLDADQLKEWREDYCLSELWEKNVIGGRPSR